MNTAQVVEKENLTQIGNKNILKKFCIFLISND